MRCPAAQASVGRGAPFLRPKAATVSAADPICWPTLPPGASVTHAQAAMARPPPGGTGSLTRQLCPSWPLSHFLAHLHTWFSETPLKRPLFCHSSAHLTIDCLTAPWDFTPSGSCVNPRPPCSHGLCLAASAPVPGLLSTMGLLRERWPFLASARPLP